MTRFLFLLWGLIIYAAVCAQSFDGDNIPDTHFDYSSLPGPTQVSKYWYHSGTRKSVFTIPSGNVVYSYRDEDGVLCKTRSYLESDFRSLAHLYFQHGELRGVGSHCDDKRNYLHSMAWNSLALYSGLEWSVDKTIWHDCGTVRVEGTQKVSDESAVRYNRTFIYPENYSTVETSKMWSSLMDDKFAKEKYERDGYIDLYVRYVYFFQLKYQENTHDASEEELTGYFHPSDGGVMQLTIYRCDAGVLAAKDSHKNPAIGGDPSNGYAMYEYQETPVDVTSELKQNSRSRIQDLVDGYSTSVPQNDEQRSGRVDNSIGIGYFKKGKSKLKVGDQHEVVRRIYTNAYDRNFICESNSIRLTVFPKPVIEGIEKDKSVVTYCPTKRSLPKVGDDLEYVDKDLLVTLEGNPCDFGDFAKYASTYGVRYGWRYWTKRNPARKKLVVKSGSDKIASLTELYDFDNDNNGPNLNLPLYALKEGETYYFEQCIVLTNFEDHEVYPTDVEGLTSSFYEVRLSRSLDEMLLKVDISQKETCLGDNVEEVRFTAMYGDMYGENENPQDYKLNQFTYQWQVGEESGRSTDSVDVKRSFDDIQGDVRFVVTMTDYCGSSITNEQVLRVNSLPSFGVENIVGKSENISVEDKNDLATTERYLLLTGIRGRQYSLSIADTEKKSYDYFYSAEDDGESLTKMLLTGFKETVRDTVFYFYKKSRNGARCLSKPVKVKVVGVEEITGNRFLQDMVYVCPGSQLPAMNANNIISDAEMRNIDFAYRWLYSTDGLSWYPMKNTDSQGNDTYFEQKNYDGTWNRAVKESEKIYIKRIASAVLPDGTVLGSDESNVLTVTTYSMPNLSVMVDGSLAVDPKCWGDTVTLSMGMNEKLLAEQELMKQTFGGQYCLSRYGYYDFDGESYLELDNFKNIRDWSMATEKNYAIYAGVDFCGTMVYSQMGVDVETYEKMDVTPVVSPCKIVGMEVTVRAAKDGYDCEIIRSGAFVENSEGVSEAKFLIERKSDYKYKIRLEDRETGCVSTVAKKIKESEIEDRKVPMGIGPNGNVKDVEVCAGTELTLESRWQDDSYKTYSWSVDGVIQTGKDKSSLVYNFPNAGTSYKVERECFYYRDDEMCYTVVDEVEITTRPALEKPVVTLEENQLCQGEPLVAQVTVNGGGSETGYWVTLMPFGEMSKNVVGEGDKVEFTETLSSTKNIYAVVTDALCDDANLYAAQSDKVKVVVEKDLDFSISSDNFIVTPEDFKKGQVTLPVTLEGVSRGEVLTYKLNGEDRGEVTYNGSSFALIIDSMFFASTGKVELVMVRQGTKVGRCESSAAYTFVLNEGFSGTPLVTSAGKTNEVEACGGESVLLEVTNVDEMTFGERNILKMTNAEWTWYLGNSPVMKTSGSEGASFTVQAEEGKSKSYSVVFSAKDEGGKIRRISSNSFVVKGSAGVKVGRIRFVEYGANGFVEYCKNSEADVAIACDVASSSLMQWEYSYDGISDWTSVPSVWNHGNVTTANVLKVELGQLENKDVYFRLKMENDCGTVSHSDNILLIRFKREVEMPVLSLASTNLYASEYELPDSLIFTRHYNHHDPYEFMDRGVVTDLGGTSQRVYFTDKIHFGENQVDVLRYEKARISEDLCASDTLHYTFAIYQKLGVPDLGKVPVDEVYCSNDGKSKYFELRHISGGDSSSYKTSWQYKQENGDWTLMKEGSNGEIFTASIGSIERNFDEFGQSIKITDLTETITVRAFVTCDNDYPGGYVVSNEVTMAVYVPLKDNGINIASKVVCFNTAVDTIKGYPAEGGSGRYSYTWYKSEDNEQFTKIVKGETDEPNFSPRNFGGTYNLQKTTYFKRRVTDDVCGDFYESPVKTVYVRDRFEVLAEDVDYSRVVTNMSKAEMWGVTDFSESGTGDLQYIWWSSPNKKHAESAVNEVVQSEPLTVPTGEDFRTYIYYVQALKEGCPSANKLDMDIYVYNQTGGSIAVEDHDPDKGDYWTCSGNSDIHIVSDDYSRNARFSWYFIVGERTYALKGTKDGKVTSMVTTPEVSLDTTNMTLSPYPFKNTLGVRKSVRLFRVTTIETNGVQNNLLSDTIILHVVPTLESVSNALLADGNALAGEIELRDNKSDYCVGESPNAVLGYLDTNLSEIWDDYRNLLGPWLYDKSIKDGFTTYYEYAKDSLDWVQEKKYDYATFHYAGENDYYVSTKDNVMDGSYRVRRVMDDGCTTLASNVVHLDLFDKVLNPDIVRTYAFTPESVNRNNTNYAIRTGFEVGDSIVFTSYDTEATNLVWFSDRECTDTLMVGNRYCSLMLDEEMAELKAGEGAYIYAKAKRLDCYGDLVSIPFEYGTTSDGGVIFIEDSVICWKTSYSSIISEREAAGTYLAPLYGPMQWTYGWEYKRSTSAKATWSSIPGENGSGLSADVINQLSESSVSTSSPLLIRRVATNEKGRVRYSNVLTLSHYEEIVPGVLSLNGTSNSFCMYDQLPYVKSTSATGGMKDGDYRVQWQYQVNAEEWKIFECADSLYLGFLSEGLDRSVQNRVQVRCLFSDECDEVEGEPLSVVFYSENVMPRIYQNNDSCNSQVVKLAVYQEEESKTYQWTAVYIDPEDENYTEKQIWNYVGEECMIVRSGMPTSQYAVRSVDDKTGCVSDYFYFNVDSLPALSQTAPLAPTSVCYGSDLEIRGGTISGGNGEKEYRWQMSTIGEESDFSDLAHAVDADLKLSSRFFKVSAFFRRIVSDMCAADTSDAVYVQVKESVPVRPDDVELQDFRCPNVSFTVICKAEFDTLAKEEYWMLGEEVLQDNERYHQMEGFEGDSVSYPLAHFMTDSTGLTCQSEVVYVTVHNKPSIHTEENIIATDNYQPCNESYITIQGETQSGDYSEMVRYRWFVNGNEQLGKNTSDLKLRANDTMRIVRVADNGCERDTSNELVLAGQMVFAYDYTKELSLEVVSNVSDSSVVVNIHGSKEFSANYYFVGDGEMPNVRSNNITLPYKYDAYKDSVLEIYAVKDYCVKPYTLQPLRGGVVSFDGDSATCGGIDVSPIVVTEMEGTTEECQYQWQYRNERTADFINIEGATRKSYVPDAIEVATTYRRIAVEGIYKSISNEITLSIRPLPKVGVIALNRTAEEMRDLDLTYKEGKYCEWTGQEDLTLTCLAENADNVYWQKSYDKKKWVLGEENEQLQLSDTAETVYYRMVAKSSCGSDTGSVMEVYKLQIDPITDDEISPWVNTTYLCYNTTSEKRLYFELWPKKDCYLYSYRISSNSEVYAHASVDGKVTILTDTMLIGSQPILLFKDGKNGEKILPNDHVTLYVTRHDTLHKTKCTRAFEYTINNLTAGFTMTVDGEELVANGEGIHTIRQGSRVEFHPQVKTNVLNSELTYRWVLEPPVNADYFRKYSGREGMEGLVSERESPTCYYYNGGYYPVTLKVSDGVCESQVTDTTLYIPETSLRDYKMSLSFEEDATWEYAYPEVIRVYPLFVDDVLHVESSDAESHEVQIVDELGRIVYAGTFQSSLTISVASLKSGVYIVWVDEKERWKVVKE